MKTLLLISVVCYRCLVVPSKQTLRFPISFAYLRTFVVILLIQLLHIFFKYFQTIDQPHFLMHTVIYEIILIARRHFL